jgi:Uma2 family endonuclease
VVSGGSEVRDYNEKREEYLRAGVREYWILDPRPRILLAQRRLGDVWQDFLVPADAVYRTHLLPGLEVRPGELLGPAEAE